MRKLLAVMLSLFMVSTLAFAKPTTQLEFATMSKADSQFLFKDGAKVVALDKTEMKSTEGKWFWFSPWFYTASFGIARWAVTSGQYAPSTFNNIYNWYKSW